ncbi:MAG: helix-turn-helix transcriptional regulator [Elusimicrobia bacterium]|nr:helix-turn-helix transcriptional regulator [Elusimicrobiota bacterium]
MTTKELRASIGERVRKLRQERRLTQTRLAKALSISQNYLSELERGQGSFTAEQLLGILRLFNVSADYFAPNVAPTQDQLQNALARLGAKHLAENDQTIPSDRLKTAIGAIREALVSADSSRQVAGIAPILVDQAGTLSLSKLHTDFIELGLEFRLGWLIDSVLEALRREESSKNLPREWRLKYRKARVIIDSFTASWRKYPGAPGRPPDYAVLDPEITSEETLREVKARLSPIARRWRIITEIKVEDFIRALRAARGVD